MIVFYISLASRRRRVKCGSERKKSCGSSWMRSHPPIRRSLKNSHAFRLKLSFFSVILILCQALLLKNQEGSCLLLLGGLWHGGALAWPLGLPAGRAGRCESRARPAAAAVEDAPRAPSGARNASAGDSRASSGTAGRGAGDPTDAGAATVAVAST